MGAGLHAQHLIVFHGREKNAGLSEAAIELVAVLVNRSHTAWGFRIGGHVDNAFGGAVAGLLKAVRREFPELGVKIIDAPADQPRQFLASSICAEIAYGATEIEVDRATHLALSSREGCSGFILFSASLDSM